MSAQLNPYLNFRTGTEEAMDFYASVFGGTVNKLRFSDFGVSDDPAEKDKLMHSQLETDFGMTLMAADVPDFMELTPGNSMSIAVSCGAAEAQALRGYFEAISAGGTVSMPLAPAPWGGNFGSCTDKFGVQWLFNIGDE